MNHLDDLAALAADLTPEQIDDLVQSLPPGTAEILLAELSHEDEQANLPPLLPHQQPPSSDDWDGWLLTGGRGVGKTYAGARWIGDLAAATPGLRGRIIAPTLGDAVSSVVMDPQSGIMATHPEAELKRSGVEGVRVVWPNGATIWCVGTASPGAVDRLRALTNIDADLFEEAAANPYLAEAVEQARLSRRGLRLPKPLWIATTTPRPLPTIREWVKGGDGEVIAVTRATTHDNPHTPDAYRRLADKLKGTRTYRQEVLGEIVDDVEGALWSFDDLKRSKRLDRRTVLDGLSSVAVGVDPPSGAGTCGIVAVGATDAGQVYVLDDYSLEDVTAGQWAHRVAEAHTDLHTLTGIEPVVVAEINQGGRMVTEVLRQASLSMPLKTVRATEGKKTRAEPVALLWEADEQHAFLSPEDVDSLAKLEDQMLTWVPGTFSPDRVDALVWAVTHLRNRPGGSARVTNPARAGRTVPRRGATSSRGRFGR